MVPQHQQQQQSSSLEQLVESAIEQALTVASSATTTERELQAEHGKDAEELNGNDADGEQGGQLWKPPTSAPSRSPTASPSGSPTLTPTYHPTLHGDPFTLRGSVFYDRNANGERDSNIAWVGFSKDVEYTHGLGGVTIQLVQCDPETNEELVEEDTNTYASGITIGMDVTGHPILGQGAGTYTLTGIKVNRSYFITATAPQGYLFTYGICNDEIKGWECNHSTNTISRRFLEGEDTAGTTETENVAHAAQKVENTLGISTGRSIRCISIDKSGYAEGNLDLGVMRLGDSKEVSSYVALQLDFDDVQAGSTPQDERKLVIKDVRVLRGVKDDIYAATNANNEGNNKRYLLGDDDKAAIGHVTAEVLAGTLDKRLADNGVELDGVLPKEVINNAEGSLAVAMEVKGHYSPPPELDFDYIVQDSINRDSDTIRRGLRDYNQNCRDQTTKVLEEGFSESDFDETVSTSGSRPNRGKGKSSSGSSSTASTAVFRTACSQGNALPEYFETSLKQIEARKAIELEEAPAISTVIYMSEEARLESWAMGPIAALAGMITLLMGAFVFRRAIGPRRVDKYRDSNKTKVLASDGDLRFGEAGGPMDDGSVDSAFYSDDSDDEEFDDHAKKMKHKRKKEKNFSKGKSLRNFQKKDDPHHKSMRSLKIKKGDKKGLTSSFRSSQDRRHKKGLTSSFRSNKSDQDKSEKARLTASTGSNDTDSVGKYSEDSHHHDHKKKRHSKKERNNSSITSNGHSRRKSEDSDAPRRKSNKSRESSRDGERRRSGKHSKRSSDGGDIV